MASSYYRFQIRGLNNKLHIKSLFEACGAQNVGVLPYEIVDAFIPDEECLSKLKSLSLVVDSLPIVQSFYKTIAEDHDPQVPKLFALDVVNGMQRKTSTWTEWINFLICTRSHTD